MQYFPMLPTISAYHHNYFGHALRQLRSQLPAPRLSKRQVAQEGRGRKLFDSDPKMGVFRPLRVFLPLTSSVALWCDQMSFV